MFIPRGFQSGASASSRMAVLILFAVKMLAAKVEALLLYLTAKTQI
jgi:hypothetical protein